MGKAAGAAHSVSWQPVDRPSGVFRPTTDTVAPGPPLLVAPCAGASALPGTEPQLVPPTRANRSPGAKPGPSAIVMAAVVALLTLAGALIAGANEPTAAVAAPPPLSSTGAKEPAPSAAVSATPGARARHRVHVVCAPSGGGTRSVAVRSSASVATDKPATADEGSGSEPPAAALAA